ncbi:uncharacterized protein [Anolis sagrei]|uniref:uncharacterized protein isoform X1 n=1 Tax=Anolis sagrei TaxID=38937 RepID=UPI003521A8F1
MGTAWPSLPCLWGWLPLLTAAALCSWGTQGKVYYSCGAQFKSIERGLILSPGFPNNYSSGIHCIWQFFIPAGTYLMLEIFDFDVFESLSEDPNAWDDFLTLPQSTKKEFPHNGANTDFPSIFPTKSPTLQNFHSTDLYHLHGGRPKTASEKQESTKQFQQIKEPRELVITQPSQPPFMAATNVTLLRRMNSGIREESKDPKDQMLVAHLTASGRKKDSEGSQQHAEDTAFGQDEDISTMTLSTDMSSNPVASMEICPHDVLYVSDLFAFSSRFCGTNSPQNKNMTFGSSLKMVEVIVELITTTDRGRGFAMLFEYKNDTELVAMSDSNEGKENVMMLVIITGILFFALVLLSSLCIACRQKLCPKRSSLDVHCERENGIQNAAADINELRLVMPNQENENNNHSMGGNGTVTSCNGSVECLPPQTDPDVPSSVSALTTESGSEEVFIVSASPGAGGLNFTSCQIQEKILRRSFTSPGSVSNWMIADEREPSLIASERTAVATETHCPGQHTWSTRAFHDLLAPFPQLQRKWCSWTTNNPFTKLVNNGGFSTSMKNQTPPIRKVISTADVDGNSELASSDSSTSPAFYPLTHSVKKACKLSSSCILKRPYFGNPYRGFLTRSPSCNRPRLSDPSRCADVRSPASRPSQGAKVTPEGAPQLQGNASNRSKSKELSPEMNPKLVFVISEEGEDQQPLVLAEHINPFVDSHAETNVVICNLQMAMTGEQAVDLPFQEVLPEITNIRTDHGLWGEHPNSSRCPKGLWHLQRSKPCACFRDWPYRNQHSSET